MKPVIILIIIFFIVRFLKNSGAFWAKKAGKDAGGAAQGPERATNAASPPNEAAEETVLDPVCSSYIPLSEALSVNAGARTVHFCSKECMDKFLASGGSV